MQALPMKKLIARSETPALRKQYAGRHLVFTNGCFDLLHVGHVRYLAAARELGDALVVGLNGDRSVRELKGPDRPINQQNDRAEMLAALASVDHVVIFEEPRATALIRELRPDVYVKGGDYNLNTLDQEEVAVLRNIMARIQILPIVPGQSTTALIQALRKI
jgi:rfaE bifunctional protein nucleotidyltransferase chain/domain